MDYMSWFYIESKFFELSVPKGRSVLQLVERRHGLSHVMPVGKFSVARLKTLTEKLVCLA